MSAFFSKADVEEHLFRLSPNVCFRPEADIQLDPNTYILNVCFRESGHSRDYSLNPSLLRTSTNSGWSRMGSEKRFEGYLTVVIQGC